VKKRKEKFFVKSAPKSSRKEKKQYQCLWLFYIFRKKLKKVVKRAKVPGNNSDIISVSKKITSCGGLTPTTNPRLFFRGRLPKLNQNQKVISRKDSGNRPGKAP